MFIVSIYRRVCRTPKEIVPAVDSGYDEHFTQSPSMLSECVEVYATNEVQQPQPCFNENYIQTEVGQEWNNYDDSVVYAPSAPIQQFNSNIPQQTDVHEVQNYDDLIESQLVDEIYSDLDQWYNKDPCFAQEMQEEKAAIASAEEYAAQADEIIPLDDDDLFQFFN